MDTVKGIVRTLSFWVFVVVALLSAVLVIYPLPVFGEIIAGLTILALSVQGTETYRAKRELDQRHKSVLQDIEQARQEAAKKHSEALQQIEQARKDAASQHDQALQQINQARQEAAKQYADAVRAINKARDEARAEDMLLRAEKFATSLLEKDELVNEAIALCPDFKQRGWIQLGMEMSAAVIGNSDQIKWEYLRAHRLVSDSPLLRKPLEAEEKTYFIEHAIQYLTETVGQAADRDAVVGLVYLACMLGCAQQYEQMILMLEKAQQISPVVQVMEGQFRKQPMLFLLLDACGSDPSKVERLWETLALPQFTEQDFCTYITEHYPQSAAYHNRHYSEWVAITRPDTLRGRKIHSALMKIALEDKPEDGKTTAFFGPPNGSTEDIVPPDKPVPVEDLYSKLCEGFIFFCPLN